VYQYIAIGLVGIRGAQDVVQ